MQLGLLLLPVWKEDLKTFCPTSCNRPGTTRPVPYMINIQWTLGPASDLYKNVSLVVLFGSNGNSYKIFTQSEMWVYVHIFFTIKRRWIGKNKFKKTGQQGMPRAKEFFAHRYHRFESPGLDDTVKRNVSRTSVNNCARIWNPALQSSRQMHAKQDTDLNCIPFTDENTLYIKQLTLNSCRTENTRNW